MDRCISAPADSLSVTGCMTASVPLLVCASAKGSIRPDVTAIKPSSAFNSLNGSKLGNNQPDCVTLTSVWPARVQSERCLDLPVPTPSSNQLIESNTRSSERARIRPNGRRRDARLTAAEPKRPSDGTWKGRAAYGVTGTTQRRRQERAFSTNPPDQEGLLAPEPISPLLRGGPVLAAFRSIAAPPPVVPSPARFPPSADDYQC